MPQRYKDFLKLPNEKAIINLTFGSYDKELRKGVKTGSYNGPNVLAACFDALQ